MSEVDTRLQDAIDILLRLGWRRESRIDGRYEIWESLDQSIEAVLPLNSSAGDFDGLLARFLGVIRESDPLRFDNLRREAEVLAAASLATVHWHKETALPPGLISWEQGEELYQCARQQLAASAKATVEKRRYYGNRSSYVAKSFLNHTYMGVPEAASYVVTALTPRETHFYSSKSAETSASTSPGRLLDPETVTGDQILETYARALNALRIGLDEYAKAPRLDPIIEAVAEGLSFEFTRSLEGILIGGDTEIEISRNPRGGSISRVEFRASESAILSHATAELALDTEPRFVTLTGEVTLLKREHGNRDRLVRLDVTSGETEANKVKVRLTPDQYEEAIEAHKSEGELQVSGTISREANNYWIYEVSALSIVPPDRLIAPPSAPNLIVQDTLPSYDE